VAVKKSGKCVYCLNDFIELTSDHVFPSSWYPETTPENLEKWQVPSCEKCNKKYGKIEEDLLIRFGLTISPNKLASLGISDKVLRSLNPKKGRNIKDTYMRYKKRQKFISDLIPAYKYPINTYVPNFEPKNTYQYYNGIGIPLPCNDLILFAKKLVKGITYITKDQYLDENFEINVFFLENNDAEPIKNMINKFGIEYHRGPGIKITIGNAIDAPEYGAYHILIWNRINIYCLVMPAKDILIKSNMRMEITR